MPGKFPRRPGYGRKGRAIPLLTNFFKVHLPSDLTLYHYDVVIEPSVPKAVKRKVMQIAVVNNKDKFIGQYPVFDGEKNLYCHKKLSNSEVSEFFPPTMYMYIYLHIMCDTCTIMCITCT